MRNKYLDIHEDDGMRHSGLVPTREDREQERLYAELTRLRRRMEIAEAALTKYADKEAWKSTAFSIDLRWFGPQTYGYGHGWEPATQALEQMKGGE